MKRAMLSAKAVAGHVWPLVRSFGAAALDVLFPEVPPCPACHRSMPSDELGLCSKCLEQIPCVAPPLCRCCGRPLRNVHAVANDAPRRKMRPVPSTKQQSDKDLCRLCNAYRRFFAAARAPFVYDGTVKDYIHRFKYGGERELGTALGVLLGRYLEREPTLWPVDAIVPVPLHPSRLEERGFNQAEVLARVVGDWVGRPVMADVLLRARPTETQTKLSAKTRRENVQGTFRAWLAERLAGRRLLLVDDVLTSGATADEAARTLLKAGATRVNVLTVAVGVLPEQW